MASPFNPNEPIPNDPFYYERTAAIAGPLGPIEVGSGLEVTPGGEMIAVGGGPAVTYLTAGPGIYVNANTGTVRIVNTGVLNLAAGNGIGLVRDTNNGTWTITNTAPAVNLGGTVTQVNTGDGLVGGPITTSGTIALSNTGVSAGTYQNATITIDAKGRVTAASPGSAISTISGNAPIVVTPGANATVSINEGSSTAIGALRVCDAINVTCSAIAASSTAVKNAYDVASAALPCSVLAAQGDLISAAAAGIPVRVPAGVDGSFLKVCTACAGTGGLTWDSLTFCEGTVTSVSAGNGLTGGTITTSGTIALDTACVISPTLFTSQGALLTATGPNAPTALGVGSNGQLLSANNLCSEGLEWVTPTPSVPCSAFNVKGDILVATGPASYAALPVGANGTLLLACSACTEGVTWATPQTSPFITYTTSAITYTNGTPILVAIWGGGTMQGTVTLDMTGYGIFMSYWDFYLTGDATNGPSGWVQPSYFPPTSDGRSQGTWYTDYPVYPSPNNAQWEIYFSPTADALNPSTFTFFYRLLGGNNPNWQI